MVSNPKGFVLLHSIFHNLVKRLPSASGLVFGILSVPVASIIFSVIGAILILICCCIVFVQVRKRKNANANANANRYFQSEEKKDEMGHETQNKSHQPAPLNKKITIDLGTPSRTDDIESAASSPSSPPGSNTARRPFADPNSSSSRQQSHPEPEFKGKRETNTVDIMIQTSSNLTTQMTNGLSSSVRINCVHTGKTKQQEKRRGKIRTMM